MRTSISAILTCLAILTAVAPAGLSAQCWYCDHFTDCTDWLAGGSQCYDDDGGCSMAGSCKTTIYTTYLAPAGDLARPDNAPGSVIRTVKTMFGEVDLDCGGRIVVRRYFPEAAAMLHERSRRLVL